MPHLLNRQLNYIGQRDLILLETFLDDFENGLAFGICFQQVCKCMYYGQIFVGRSRGRLQCGNIYHYALCVLGKKVLCVDSSQPTTFKKIMARNAALVAKLAEYSGLEHDVVYNLVQFVKAMVKPSLGLVDESIFMAVLAKYFGIMEKHVVRKMFEAVMLGTPKGATVESVSKMLCTFFTEDVEQQIEFIFSVYDVDRDGQLDMVELTLWLKSCTLVSDDEADTIDPIQDLINITAENMGITNDGPINLETFRVKVKANPLFIQVLGHCLPSEEVAKKFLESIKGKSLVEMQATYGRMREKLLFELPDPLDKTTYPLSLEIP